MNGIYFSYIFIFLYLVIILLKNSLLLNIIQTNFSLIIMDLLNKYIFLYFLFMKLKEKPLFQLKNIFLISMKMLINIMNNLIL